jgi:hypothetical protein
MQERMISDRATTTVFLQRVIHPEVGLLHLQRWASWRASRQSVSEN